MIEKGMRLETEQEEDGRWIAEILALPGVMAYSETRIKAIGNAITLLFRVTFSRVVESLKNYLT